MEGVDLCKVAGLQSRMVQRRVQGAGCKKECGHGAGVVGNISWGVAIRRAKSTLDGGCGESAR